ncbi:hypothetical protein [Natrarchaeobius oligotrophus]|uniref:Uncharacterized protein n=1 Tax=Natrarchaeobius chitinivorans TaxID=1679083 RepID=A0A3N6MQV1_NATCH|nr:hypothetical protein [Natrarchaeobius chitinivorans]RQH00061.1 hypothetical protein EA472_12685 [Natrarchaeobius chitinivorans]
MYRFLRTKSRNIGLALWLFGIGAVTTWTAVGHYEKYLTDGVVAVVADPGFAVYLFTIILALILMSDVLTYPRYAVVVYTGSAGIISAGYVLKPHSSQLLLSTFFATVALYYFAVTILDR